MGIRDNYVFPTTDGTANQVLQTDGAGNVSWTDFSELEDVDQDTKIQLEENTDEDIIRFDMEEPNISDWIVEDLK